MKFQFENARSILRMLIKFFSRCEHFQYEAKALVAANGALLHQPEPAGIKYPIYKSYCTLENNVAQKYFARNFRLRFILRLALRNDKTGKMAWTFPGSVVYPPINRFLQAKDKRTNLSALF